MPTIQENLDLLNKTKQAIKTALKTKYIDVSDSDSFSSYAAKIDAFDGVDVQKNNIRFENNTELTVLPCIYNFGNVTDFTGMFKNCVNLKSSYLDKMPLLDTRKATTTKEMFYGCKNICDTIPLFDTSNVKDMSYMFYNCKQLYKLPRFDTSKVTNMSYMFYGCQAFHDVPIFNTSNVTDMSYMFYGTWYNVKGLVMPLLDTSKVTNMEGMFQYVRYFYEIPQLNTSNVENVSYMFNCAQSELSTIPLLDFSKVKTAENMFYNVTSLTDLGGFKNLSVSLDISSSYRYLTKNSIINIINNLKDMTGESTSPTLKLGVGNLDKLNATEKAIATNKNWVLA